MSCEGFSLKLSRNKGLIGMYPRFPYLPPVFQDAGSVHFIFRTISKASS
jgi:hypothetical protein